MVVSFQYSLRASPLSSVPMIFSTFDPSSFFSFQVLGPISAPDARTSSLDLPFSVIVALSYFQHWSYLPTLPSSSQLVYLRSMKDSVRSNPSPTQDTWLFVAEVRPSTDCAEYEKARLGVGPAAAGGTRSGYDQVKSPLEPPPDQLEEADNPVAE